MEPSIPQANYALIGGSGTWGIRFPEDLHRSDIELVEIYDKGFETPYGQSIAFKHLKIDGESVLRVVMHGRKYGEDGYPVEPQWIAAHQVASVLKNAGVKWALTESSVGGIQSPDLPGEPLPPWSVVITDDFINLWNIPAVSPPLIGIGKTARLREPFCAKIRKALTKHAAREEKFVKVFDHGVYLNTPWGRFETSAEIKAYAKMGAHVAGQTLAYEVPLMRRLGIHFGSLSIVSNYAEGVSTDWVGKNKEDFSRFYFDCAPIVGNVMVNALKDIISNKLEECNCNQYYLEGHHQFPVPGA